MSVRQKVYDQLISTSLTDLLPGGVMSGGSLTGRISRRPFLVYRVQDSLPALVGDDSPEVLHTNVEIWVYDEPGSYSRIESIIELVRSLVENTSGLKTIFRGVSGELPDDDQKAIVKNVAYSCSEIS